MARHRRLPRASSGAFAALLLLALPAAARIDPFYEQLAERGRIEASQGLAAEGARHLRLACFGMLDEPRRLAHCLVSLAVAEGDAGDRAGFAATFDRLVEVERRFSALSQAAVPAGELARFEQRAGEWMDYEALSALPFLQGAARRQLEESIAALPRDEQRRRLAERVAAEPDELGWRVLAAELSLAAGDAGEALESLDAVLRRTPELRRALCLRGVARAELGRCAEGLADVAACDQEVRPEWRRPLLACAVEVADWTRAEELLAGVPAEERGRSPYRRWEREIARGLEALAANAAAEAEAAPPTASTDAPPPAASPDSPPPAAPPAAPPATAPAEHPEAAELRHLLATAASRGELETVMARVAPLADANPRIGELQQIAGEASYRLARWRDAVTYFERGSPLPARRPELGFYYAVALYEQGDREAAAAVLEAILPRMQRTPFVQSYADKILTGTAGD